MHLHHFTFLDRLLAFYLKKRRVSEIQTVDTMVDHDFVAQGALLSAAISLR